MSLYKIVTQEDDLLRKVSKEVPKITPNVIRMINNMLDTMYEANGVGLAAPQIGTLKRVIVVDIGEGPIALINPVILEKEGTQTSQEGCLSCPEVWGEVERAQKIKVFGVEPDGKEVVIEAEDFLAVALQHEIDHLDGILFIDRATKLKAVKQ